MGKGTVNAELVSEGERNLAISPAGQSARERWLAALI
jgi:hypothetical protein